MSTKYEKVKFGTLTVLDAYTTKTSGGNPKQILKLRCDCGNTYERTATSVWYSKAFKENRDSMTCVKCKHARERKQSLHGYMHPLYGAWRNMVARCHDDTTHSYFYYGARRISVCDRWRGARPNGEMCTKDGFSNFLEDMGDKPSSKHSIDRIDTDGDYTPDNCRWATPLEQRANQRDAYKTQNDLVSISVSISDPDLALTPRAEELLSKLKDVLAKNLEPKKPEKT